MLKAMIKPSAMIAFSEKVLLLLRFFLAISLEYSLT